MAWHPIGSMTTLVRCHGLSCRMRLSPSPELRSGADCPPTVQVAHGGAKAATSGKMVLARVNGLLLATLDDVVADRVVWMPSHKPSDDVWWLKPGDGTFLTELGRIGNNTADSLAKEAAHTHKVLDDIIDALVAQEKLVEETVRLVAEMAWAANHQAQEPFRDTDASRTAAAQAAALKRQAGMAQRKRCKWTKVVELCPPTLGGHKRRRNGCWRRCTVCKQHIRKWAKIAPKECTGSCARRWAERAKMLADQGTMVRFGHTRAFSARSLAAQDAARAPIMW